MQNIKNTKPWSESPWGQWTRKDSEDLIVLYLNDYYNTLDDYFLKEALQIAKEDGIDIEPVMRRVRFQLS